MAHVQAPPGKRPGPAQQKAKAALGTPLPTGAPGKKRIWPLFLILFVLLAGATYAAGRFIEPVRLRFEKIPVVGERLFAKATPADEAPEAEEEGEQAPEPANDPVQQALENVAKREAEVAARESEVKLREEALTAREAELNQKAIEFDKKEEEIEQLRLEMQGRIEEDQARAAIIGSMKATQAAAMLEVMDDDAVLRLVKHLDAETSAKIFAAMDPYRAARLMLKLGGGELKAIN